MESTDIFTSTRDNKISAGSFDAIANGISGDGGLYVPTELKPFSARQMAELSRLSYTSLCAEILAAFFPEFEISGLEQACKRAYSSFDCESVAPLVRLGDDYVCELWHGPTAAFKDIALQLLPELLSVSLNKLNNSRQTLILTATSGDTGSAAMRGFSGRADAKVFVVYPFDNVSEVQKKQMTALRGDNCLAVGISGDFDDAQRAVKSIFADADFARSLGETRLSSANSINIGRLAPQIVYYFSSYFSLLNSGGMSDGEQVDFVVPSGNFGDILAGLYAKLLGLPVGRLICASNSNRVLADFIETGVYDANRKLCKTTSPSMDILISSNVERLLYIIGCGDRRVKALQNSLLLDRRFRLSEEEHSAVAALFSSYSAGEYEISDAIKLAHDTHNYILDPHTAAGYCALNARRGKNKTVLLSTANAHKFPRDVLFSLCGNYIDNEFEASELLEKAFGLEVPKGLSGLRASALSPVRCELSELRTVITRFALGGD